MTTYHQKLIELYLQGQQRLIHDKVMQSLQACDAGM